MIKLVPIKPKRSRLDPRAQRAAIEAGMQDTADLALKDFESTTKTWSKRPTFTAKKQADGILIGTDDDIWQMLNEGTRPHDIVATKIALRFPGSFAPKTRPGFLGSTGGGASGGAVFRKRIHHPGTTARGWSKLIKKKWTGRLGPIVQKRLNEAMR